MPNVPRCIQDRSPKRRDPCFRDDGYIKHDCYSPFVTDSAIWGPRVSSLLAVILSRSLMFNRRDGFSPKNLQALLPASGSRHHLTARPPERKSYRSSERKSSPRGALLIWVRRYEDAIRFLLEKQFKKIGNLEFSIKIPHNRIFRCNR